MQVFAVVMFSPFHCSGQSLWLCRQPTLHLQLEGLTDDSHQLSRELLRRILAVARHLSASADLTDILNVIIDAMRDTLNADRATVFEFDPSTNELFTSVAHGMETKPGQSAAPPRVIRVPATAGLAGECAQSRRIINVPDAYADARFNQSVDKQTGYRTRSILTIPLLGHDGELVGVAQVLNKRESPGMFTAEDEEIAESLAAQAAVAMKRGRLIEDRMVRKKLERDIELARTIQQSSFPDRLPGVAGFDIAAWNEPADKTGGDVYDIVVRDLAISPSGDLAIESSADAVGQWPRGQMARSSNDRVVLLMADATGHGVGPAISVTQLRSMLRMAVRLGADLEQVARHANQQLCSDLPGGRFITAWFGELDATASTLISFSAGQAPLLRYIAGEDRFDLTGADALPLGVMDLPDASPPQCIHMQPGDIFAVISDGIFESRDYEDNLFGADRVQDCLREFRHLPAREMITNMLQRLETFTKGRPADDDRTAIVIKCCVG
jgi:sigma-B regulation protein RsbU (phosphoserine phosphatase)